LCGVVSSVVRGQAQRTIDESPLAGDRIHPAHRLQFTVELGDSAPSGTTTPASSCIGQPNTRLAPSGRKRTPIIFAGPHGRRSVGELICPAKKNLGCRIHRPSLADSNGGPKFKINSGRPSGTTRCTASSAAGPVPDTSSSLQMLDSHGLVLSVRISPL
jgi:hypothetical protein